jgi:hypothetical protein
MASYPPAFVDEYFYAMPGYMSGVSGTFGAVGASAIFDALSGVENHSYAIFGWQAVFDGVNDNDKGHLILKLTCNLGTCAGLMHCSDDDNTVVMLPQPLRLPSGSGVYWVTVSNQIKAGTGIHLNVFYSLVPDR